MNYRAFWTRIRAIDEIPLAYEAYFVILRDKMKAIERFDALCNSNLNISRKLYSNK